MPSKKVIAILIICVSGIISAWLISSIPSLNDVKNSQKETLVNSVSVSAYKQIDSEKNDDWKKLLNTIDTKNQKIEKVAKTTSDTFEENSITATLSVDLMSQYLLLVKSGKDITSQDADIIAQKVLSQSKYTNTNPVIYRSINLNIIQKNDKETLTKYRDTIYKLLKEESSKIKEDPRVMIMQYQKDKNDKDLKSIDITITATKNIIDGFLKTEVPFNLVQLHLSIINSFSSMLSNVEAIRNSPSDPILVYLGFNEYDKKFKSIKDYLEILDIYLNKKLN